MGLGSLLLFGIISSLVNKTSGTVKVFGFDTEEDVVRSKQHLGIVPQEFNFNQFEKPMQILINQSRILWCS